MEISSRVEGIFVSGVVRTYKEERLPVARQLIGYDGDVAALMSRRTPHGYDPNRDVN